MPEDNIYYIAPQGELDSFYDTFAGGGGSGSGILSAYERLGIRPNGTFVNHWDKAIEIHQANHPEHRHFKEDLFLMNPRVHMPKKKYGFGWSSPSCQMFSISRGNRPINEQGRTHADTVVEWMSHCMPEIQIVENVVGFKDWGRLRQRRDKVTKDLLWAREVPGKKKGETKVIVYAARKRSRGAYVPMEHRRAKGETEPEWELRMISLGYCRHLEPDPNHKGEYFEAWRKRIEALGYISDWKLLRSADYGDPTIRQRLFIQFVRIDTGKRIVWPDQRFIKPGTKRPKFGANPDRPLLPWPTARNSVIEWDVKGKSIFTPDRKPLAAATKRRIAIGAVRFGFKDYLVPASNFGGDRVRSTDEPVSTIQCNHRGEAIAEPFTLTSNKGFDAGIRDIDKPAATMTCNSRGEAVVEPYLIPNFGERPGQTPRTHSLDDPLPTATSHGAGGLVEAFILPKMGMNPNMSGPRDLDKPAPTVITDGRAHLVEPMPFMVSCAHGSAKPSDCYRRVSDGNEPMPTLTTSNGEAVVHPAPFIVPKDQGHKGDYVSPIDHPVPAVQTTAHDHLAEPCIITANGKSFAASIAGPLGTVTTRANQGLAEPFVVQMNGQSTAISTNSPLGAVTGMQKQYVAEPYIAHLRGGNGTSSVEEPVRAVTAGGNHQLLAEAFLQVMDNAGKDGKGQRAFSADEPLKTVPTKANHCLTEPVLKKMGGGIRFSLETLEDAITKVAPAGIDISRVLGFIEPLMDELRKHGRVDVNPWIYVYYSNGAVGADIDSPMPTVRCKEGTAICYPVLEFDGEFILLDILYRMLTVKELQRAQGFPDDFLWPPGITKTDIVKAIGNSVSCGLAEAITLACLSQQEDISGFFEDEQEAAA